MKYATIAGSVIVLLVLGFGITAASAPNQKEQVQNAAKVLSAHLERFGVESQNGVLYEDGSFNLLVKTRDSVPASKLAKARRAAYKSFSDAVGERWNIYKSHKFTVSGCYKTDICILGN